MNSYKTIILFLLPLFISCQSNNKSADIYSYEIDDKNEKLKTLKKYLIKESGLIDAEYHIWFRDNGTGRVPGSSDYNIKLALKIDSDSLDSWIEYLEPSSKKISLDQWEELKLDRKIWKLESEPELYRSSLATEVKLLFRKENIILGIYSTMPVALEYHDE